MQYSEYGQSACILGWFILYGSHCCKDMSKSMTFAQTHGFVPILHYPCVCVTVGTIILYCIECVLSFLCINKCNLAALF